MRYEIHLISHHAWPVVNIQYIAPVISSLSLLIVVIVIVVKAWVIPVLVFYC